MEKAKLTRQEILEKSFELIYRNGYQSTSIDKIIETLRVTKGAFYYHFKNKDEMGMAMIGEVIAPKIVQTLVLPIKNSDDPLTSVFKSLENDLLGSDFDPKYGCPINNLVMEMSPINQSFRDNLQGVVKVWKKALATEFERGKESGVIKKTMNSDEVAEFIIVSYEGSRGTGKVYRGRKLYRSYLNQIKNYLESFRA